MSVQTRLSPRRLKRALLRRTNLSSSATRNQVGDTNTANLSTSESGAVLPLAAAGLLLLLIVGGSGIDLGRAYMAKSRLQQACDAGALGSRAEISRSDWTTSEKVANDVFKENFPNGQYGSENLTFRFTIDDKRKVTGTAQAVVPLTLMRIVGMQPITVTANCSAETQMPNVDIVFVLDTTNSMNETNTGDPTSRIVALKSAVNDFYDTVLRNSTSEAQIRYGFVPYSANVNVGHLLKPDWLADRGEYQSRVPNGIDNSVQQTPETNQYDFQYESGKFERMDRAPGEEGCVPASDLPWRGEEISEELVKTEVVGEFTIKTYKVRILENGYATWVEWNSNGECIVAVDKRENYIQSFTRTKKYATNNYMWLYQPVTYDLTSIKANTTVNPRGETYLTGTGSFTAKIGAWQKDATVTWNGCIEERQTDRSFAGGTIPATAYDLNIDLVPDKTRPETQWKPMLPRAVYVRRWWNPWDWQLEPYNTSDALPQFEQNYAFAPCPARAEKLRELTKEQLNTFLSTLQPAGTTHHDIGMIWGARLLSAEGLFKDENQYSKNGGPIARHLILMTDGQTETSTRIYSSYGYEPIDRRRTPVDQGPTVEQLNNVVDQRFQAVCATARTKFTVWVIAFGTTLTKNLQDCASKDSAFQADNASQLDATFTDISGRIANLRLTQ